MYCPNCGVQVSDENKTCPLCRTALPDLGKRTGKPFFPETPVTRGKEDFRAPLFLLTLFFLAIGGVFLALDLVQEKRINFSFYVLAAIGLVYAAFIFPRWWKRPNPVIFFPVFFLVLMTCLLLLDVRFGTGLYLTFLLPVLTSFFLFLEAAVVLCRYLKKGKLYVFGGLFLAMGNLSFVAEILYRATFQMPICLTYSILPLVFFSVVGMALIVIAIVGPFRRYFEKRFFL